MAQPSLSVAGLLLLTVAFDHSGMLTAVVRAVVEAYLHTLVSYKDSSACVLLFAGFTDLRVVTAWSEMRSVFDAEQQHEGPGSPC